MRTNFSNKTPTFTHQGAPSSQVPPLQQLKRISMACLLWEDTFYVDGKKHTEILEDVCQKLDQIQVLNVAREAHLKGLLRHLPLFLIVQSFKCKKRMQPTVFEGKLRVEMPSDYIAAICNRPDQMTELLSLYWKNGKIPLASQLKKGLAKAFTRYDEYQLAKYNRDTPIKLRDVLFLSHAKPKDSQQAELWKRLISKNLQTPETWETKLSSGQDKKESFQELLEKGKMGKLAIVRNLRNMLESGVPEELVGRELMKKGRPILPFTFLAAAKHCMKWEPMIDKAMVQSLEDHEKFDGITVLFVDVSGSMSTPVSSHMENGKQVNSETTCCDAACAIAILLRQVCDKIDIFTFSDSLASVPPRTGMALRDAIVKSQPNSGTQLGLALKAFNSIRMKDVPIKRVIVITDEQTDDVPPRVDAEHCYIINVGSYQNGIKNNGQWLTVTGFSEHVIDYIREVEKDGL